MGQLEKIKHHKYMVLAAIAGLALIAVAVWALLEFGLLQQVLSVINEKTPPELFVLLMAFLPLAGVPISLFLFFLGVKFGLVKGLLLLAVLMPFHLLAAYGLVITVRRPLVNYLVHRKNYQIPIVPEDKAFIFSFLFLTFPVFPYVVKIYMLPLAGVDFRYCFWLNWGVQGTMCIPFVLLGRSAADLNLWLFGVTITAFVLLYLFLRWAKKQYLALQKEKIT
jgi:uncharacterized membrane protein YdjX (TVP38/TMEM64 family)